jgi:hypothetical protein
MRFGGWDQTALYVAFWCEEPYVQATLTERDALIFFDNDVEVFIDGSDTYYEFEINACNTVYEGMGWLANGRPIPPHEGDEWRIFFGRYEQLQVGDKKEAVGWAWDPIGSGDNHVPERFTPIRFTTEFLT